MNNPEASRPSLCQASLAVAKVVTVAAVETVEVGEDQVVTSCLVGPFLLRAHFAIEAKIS